MLCATWEVIEGGIRLPNQLGQFLFYKWLVCDHCRLVTSWPCYKWLSGYGRTCLWWSLCEAATSLSWTLLLVPNHCEMTCSYLSVVAEHTDPTQTGSTVLRSCGRWYIVCVWQSVGSSYRMIVWSCQTWHPLMKSQRRGQLRGMYSPVISI